MSSDMGLSIDIMADGSSAVAEIQSLETRLAALEVAFKGAGDGAVVSATGTKEAAAAASNATLSFESLSAHSATLARGFNAVGLGASAAATRVEGLIGAFDELKAAAPQLLLIAAAMTAVVGTFSFFKDGVQAAADMQSQMDTLRAAVEAQGGAWDAASESIKRFIEQESLASGFTQNDLVGSLNQLVTAGASVADAEHLISVAEETAIAHHKKLLDITNMLISAEAGRGMELGRLDPKLKLMIQHHAKLSEVLKVLHKDNANQISDGNSMEMASRREASAMQDFSEMIGSVAIPFLTGLATAMTGGIIDMEEFGSGFSHLVMGIVNIAEAAAHAIAMLWDEVSGNQKGVSDQYDATMSASSRSGQDMKASMAGFGGGFKNTDWWQAGHNSINQAIYNHNKHAGDQSLQYDPNLNLALGGKKKGGSSAGYNASDVQAAVVDTTALAAAHNSLSTALKSSTDAQAALKAVLDPTMDSEKQNELVVGRLQSAYTAAKQAIPQLIADLQRETSAEHNAQAAVQSKHDAYVEATKALNALEASLQGKTKLTVAEKQSITEAKDAQKASNVEYRTADTALKSLTKQIDDHQKALDKATKALNAFNIEQQKMIVGLNDVIEKDKEQQKEELATYGLSLNQQIAYWAQKLAIDRANSQAYYDQHKSWNAELLKQEEDSNTKLIDLQTKNYEQQDKNAQAFHAKEVSDVSTFLDNIITKHESFKTMFKSLWDDIVKIFIEDLTKMIVESKLFNSVVGGLFGGSGGAGGMAGLFAGLLGGGGSSSFGAISSGFGTAGPGLNSLLGALTGTPGSTAATALNVNTVGMAPGIFGSGNTGLSGAIASPIGVFAGALGLGAAIGGIEGANSGAPGNHELNGAIGGALGAAGIIGATMLTGGVGLAGALGGLGTGLGLLGGPIGWGLLLGGALLGGAAGGLIGPQWGPPSNYPDRSDPNYGQFSANWQGAENGANGTSYNPTSAFSGSNSMGQQMENWANSVKGSMSTLTAAQQQIAQQILALDGGNPNANLSIANLHNGVWTLADGQQISYQDAQTLWNNFQAQQQGGAIGSSATPVFNVTHSFPDWQNAQLALGGNYTPGGPTIGGTGTGTGGGAKTQPVGWKQPILPPINVGPIHVGGIVHSSQELGDMLTEIISKHLQQNIARGILQ